MRLIVIDEDLRSVPHICDELRQSGHDVIQIADWHEIKEKLPPFSPNGILLDLMIPAIDLPANGCASGFTTGAYLYREVIHPLAQGVPFVVYTSAPLTLSVVKSALEQLLAFGEYAGAISKGEDVEKVVALLRKKADVQ